MFRSHFRIGKYPPPDHVVSVLIFLSDVSKYDVVTKSSPNGRLEPVCIHAAAQILGTQFVSPSPI